MGQRKEHSTTSRKSESPSRAQKSPVKPPARIRATTALNTSKRDDTLMSVTKRVADSYSESDSDEDETVSNEILSIASKICSSMHAPSSPSLYSADVVPSGLAKQSSGRTQNPAMSSVLSPFSPSPKKRRTMRDQNLGQKLQLKKGASSLEDSDSGIEPSQWKPEPRTDSVTSSSHSSSGSVSERRKDEMLGGSDNITEPPKSVSPKKSRSSRKQMNMPVAKLQAPPSVPSHHDVSSSSSGTDDNDDDDDGNGGGTAGHHNSESAGMADGTLSNKMEVSQLLKSDMTPGTAHTTRLLRYKCPLNYEKGTSTVAKGGCLEDVQGRDVDLWLIKAPAEMDIREFSGQEALIDASVTLKRDEVAGMTYIWEAGCSQDSQTEGSSRCLLLPSKEGMKLCFAGQLRGQVHLTKTLQGLPYILPPTKKPPRTLPAGLKRRFQPFGADTPVVSSESQKKRKHKSKSRDYADGKDSQTPAPKAKKKKKRTKLDQ